MNAFKEACQSTSPSTIVIPKGTFTMNQVKLEGPCKSPLELQIQATLKAPSDPSQLKVGEWLTVNKIDQFTMSGGGILDGQAAAAWECKQSKKCNKLPNVSPMFFNGCIVLVEMFSLYGQAFIIYLSQKSLPFNGVL